MRVRDLLAAAQLCHYAASVTGAGSISRLLAGCSKLWYVGDTDTAKNPPHYVELGKKDEGSKRSRRFIQACVLSCQGNTAT